MRMENVVSKLKRKKYRSIFTTIGIALLSLIPSNAFAHAELVKTNPVINSIILKMPSSITLQANEAVTFQSNSVQLLDQNGKVLISNSNASSNNKIELRTGKTYQPGYYVVRYKIISEDEHVVIGSFGFILGKVNNTVKGSKIVTLKSLDNSTDGNPIEPIKVTFKALKGGEYETSCAGKYEECHLTISSTKYKAPFMLTLLPGQSERLVLPDKNSYVVNALVRVSLFKEQSYQGKATF